MSATEIKITVTREDIIKIVQDKARAVGLDVSPERLKDGGRGPTWGHGKTPDVYDIQVDTTHDEDEGWDHLSEMTLADLRMSFCPVISLSVTMRPLEVK